MLHKLPCMDRIFDLIVYYLIDLVHLTIDMTHKNEKRISSIYNSLL